MRTYTAWDLILHSTLFMTIDIEHVTVQNVTIEPRTMEPITIELTKHVTDSTGHVGCLSQRASLGSRGVW